MPESVLASDSSSESVTSGSTLSLLATMVELTAIGTIDDVLNWADIEAPVWNAVMVNLGRVGKLRFFAALPSDVLVVAICYHCRAGRARRTHAHTHGSDPSGISLASGTSAIRTSRHSAGGQSATDFQVSNRLRVHPPLRRMRKW